MSEASDTGLVPRARVDGRHELIERLDDRGAGEVWKARDPDFKTRFALLKVLGPLPAGASSAPAALVDLARRLRAVKHSALLPVTSVGAHAGRAYAALAWFEGASLAALCNDDPPSLGAIASLFEALCGAIEACHSSGVVHGGVTPGCVLAQRGAGGAIDARIVDVGLAPWADRGTGFLYEDCVAPEALSTQPPSPAVDVFGLGATLRRALAAHRDATTWVEPTPGFRGRADAPKAVWDAIARATSASPDARYESAASLRAALDAAWADTATLPVKQDQPGPEETAPPDAEAAPPLLWEAPPPAAPREPDFDDRATTYKLRSLAPSAPSGPVKPLSLDSLLGDEPSPPAPSVAPVSQAPVPTGAQNPWATDVLQREVHVLAPVPTGAQNPWATDVLHREVSVPLAASMTDTQIEPRPAAMPAPIATAAPQPPTPHREIDAAPPKRSPVPMVVAALVLLAAAALLIALR